MSILERITKWLSWDDSPNHMQGIVVRSDGSAYRTSASINEMVQDLISLRKTMGKVMSYQWQPIESAPKNSTNIWVWTGKDMGVAFWYEWWREALNIAADGPRPVEGVWEWADDCDGPCTPTHWMPLPEPPK